MKKGHFKTRKKKKTHIAVTYVYSGESLAGVAADG